MLSISTSQYFCSEFTLYHSNLNFNEPDKELYWKHCRKRRKCWSLSNTNLIIEAMYKLFTANAFIYGQVCFCHLVKRYVLLCSAFNNISVSKLFTKKRNLRQGWIETICRRQDKCWRKTEICFGKVREHCAKRKKCWLPAFSPFPAMLCGGLFFRVVKAQDCDVN